MEPAEGFVQVQPAPEGPPVTLHYLVWRDAGAAAAPPLLMLHATGFLARLWQPVAVRLAPHFTVWAYDARGHGDSDKPPGDYHWARFVEDLAAFIGNFGLGPLPLVGHSAGGATAVYLAAQRPELVSRLVLIEPIIMPGNFQPDESRRNEMAEGARRRRMVWPSRTALVDAYRTRPTFARWTDECLRLYAEHGAFVREDGMVQLKCPGEIEGAIFAQSGSLPIWDVLPEVRCPTLILKGEHTDEFLRTAAESAASRIPGAELGTIAGAGHLAPMEQPEAVAEAILGFVATPRSPAAERRRG
jgi:pimeloyl-ACP methyl ester carboxylesterase